MIAVDQVMDRASKLLGGVDLKETAMVQLLGLTKIPALFFFGPRVVRVDMRVRMLRVDRHPARQPLRRGVGVAVRQLQPPCSASTGACRASLSA